MGWLSCLSFALSACGAVTMRVAGAKAGSRFCLRRSLLRREAEWGLFGWRVACCAGGSERVSFVGRCACCAGGSERGSFVGRCACCAGGSERVSFVGWGVCCAGGSEQVSFARQPGSFISPSAGDRAGPVGAGPAPAPWASSPARCAGSFALSGFLTDRLDSPSLAHASLFAASLPLVLKSFLRSAAAMAPTPPAARPDF